MNNFQVTCKSEGSFIKILINGILHISFRLDTYTGSVSYIDSGKGYCIEIYSNGQMIKSEYDTKEKWVEVLKVMDNEL